MTGEPVVRPEDVLPDEVDRASMNGVDVRKGTVAAFVANARNLQRLTPGTAEHEAVAAQLRSLLPALTAVGVLEVFEPRSPALREIVAGG
jgi:hypothetical protein